MTKGRVAQIMRECCCSHNKWIQSTQFEGPIPLFLFLQKVLCQTTRNLRYFKYMCQPIVEDMSFCCRYNLRNACQPPQGCAV